MSNLQESNQSHAATLAAALQQLIDVAAIARWRLSVGFSSNSPDADSYVIEEAYEVVDAIAVERQGITEELGDLLLQVLQAQIAAESVSSATEVARHHTKADSPSSPCIWGRKSKALMKCAKLGANQSRRKKGDTLPSYSVPNSAE